MFKLPPGVDLATQAVVAAELCESDLNAYVQGILVDMHRNDPELYDSVFSLAVQDCDSALLIITHEVIAYRLICVQRLRDPQRMH